MPFEYESPRRVDQPLKQGEVLANVWEHVVMHPASRVVSEVEKMESVHHAWAVVMNSYCDLVQDFRTRNRDSNDEGETAEELPRVLLCDALVAQDVRRAPGVNSSIWRAITANQKERFHHLPAAAVSNGEGVPALTLDFRKLFGVRTSGLYDAITSRQVERRGSLPDLYREDLIHRHASFQGRVSLPG